MPADPAKAVQTRIHDEWTTNFAGRDTAVPDLVRDGSNNPSTDPSDGKGVLILVNDENLRERTSTHDIIQCQLVDKNIRMRGKDSEEVVDVVQIDIRISARDTTGDNVRDGVRARMLGERDANNAGDTLGGLAGEVRRILNNMTKGWEEYDEVDYDAEIQYIRNSDARMSFTAELRIIEQDRQRPTT